MPIIHAMRIHYCVTLTALSLAAGLMGCEQRSFPNDLPASTEEVDHIVGNGRLSPQEKRDQLLNLGFPPDVVNAILRGERTANQFGGSTVSAWNKVSIGAFTTMTPDEVQLYADAVTAANGPSFNINDDQAQATVSLFNVNAIDTSKQLDAFLKDPANEQPTTIPANFLKDVFVTFDPNEVKGQLP